VDIILDAVFYSPHFNMTLEELVGTNMTPDVKK